MSVREKDRETFKTALGDLRGIIEGAKADDRDLTPAEQEQIDTLAADAEAAKARIETDVKDDTLALRLSNLLGSEKGFAIDGDPETEPKSMGEAFTEDPLFKAWLAQNMVDGQLPESLKAFRTPTVQLGSKFINTATIGPAFPGYEDRRGVMVSEPWPKGAEALLALLSRGTTTSSVIHYAVEDWTNAADFVAEATAATGTSGSKPMSDVTYTPATVPVGTVAHWVAATKWALSDIGQLRALIDNGLRRGVLAKIAASILNGDGAAPEWFGLNTLAGIPAQAYGTSPLLTVKAAQAAVDGAGFDVNGIVMNPADWQAIDNSTPQVITDPLANRAPVIGGVPVVQLAQQPVGFALVGDFKQAWLLDREQTAITATDSHADFFIRNLVAILGEWRGAFFVTAPQAFRKADLTAA